MNLNKVSVSTLSEIIDASLARHNLTDKHRAFMLDGLIGPSLRGIDSHGIGLLQTYLLELEGGRAKAQPDIQWHHQFPVVGQMDAGQALGVVAGFEGVQKSIEVAEQFGLSAIGISNSNHFGAASNYTEYAAKQGYVCLCVSNADSLVAPFNGSEKILGTNPLSFSAPGENDDIFSLDMATSQVSLSKIIRHLATGQPIEDNWFSDVDKQNGKIGPLNPLGGYKGQGLGMMVTILTSVLTQSLFDWELSHLYAPPYDEGRQVSHFIITLNISAFSDPVVFKRRLSVLLNRIRQSGGIDGQQVLVAGDKEAACLNDRKAQGIPLIPAQLMFYRQLAEQLTVNFEVLKE